MPERDPLAEARAFLDAPTSQNPVGDLAQACNLLVALVERAERQGRQVAALREALVEETARRLSLQEWCDFVAPVGPVPWEDHAPEAQEYYRREARAALAGEEVAGGDGA